MEKTLRMVGFSLAINAAYSVYHIVFGAMTGSWWLLTVGVYYCILSTARFSVIRTKKNERILAKLTGWMLMIMSVPLVGTVILSVVKDRGTEFHEIAMIAIAAYTFTKVTLATVNLIKARHTSLQRMITLKNVSFAEALVSVFSLQRSMLVSFKGMSAWDIQVMNAIFGGVVCVTVFLLGLNLAVGKNGFFVSAEV